MPTRDEDIRTLVQDGTLAEDQADATMHIRRKLAEYDELIAERDRARDAVLAQVIAVVEADRAYEGILSRHPRQVTETLDDEIEVLVDRAKVWQVAEQAVHAGSAEA